MSKSGGGKRTSGTVMFANLKYKIINRNVVGQEKPRGDIDSSIKVFGFDSSVKKYMPLGVWSFEQVSAFLAKIVDGDASNHPDYNKVLDLVNPIKTRGLELKDDVFEGSIAKPVKVEAFVEFVSKYDPTNLFVQFLSEKK